jgi:hypothetical protein
MRVKKAFISQRKLSPYSRLSVKCFNSDNLSFPLPVSFSPKIRRQNSSLRVCQHSAFCRTLRIGPQFEKVVANISKNLSEYKCAYIVKGK